MYSSIESQLFNLIRYFASFLFLFTFLPLIFSPGRLESTLTSVVARYVKITCFLLILVYFLVAIKLYELLSVVGVLFYLYLGKQYFKPKEDILARVAVTLYDILDGKLNPIYVTQQWISAKVLLIKDLLKKHFNSIPDIGTILLLIGVLGYSAYLRFYDSLTHAAPAMSDAYVTLAWAKYIEKNILFHDGIYPHGFHIYLSLIHKFAANNMVYVLKYTGPLNNLLLVFALYFVISRWTGKTLAGIISAFTYGVLIEHLHLEWARQVAANSQEFALVFILPAWYFAYRYLETKNREYFWPAVASGTIIGLCHTLVFAFFALGLACILFTFLLINRKETIKPVFYIIIASSAAAVISVIPAGLGLLMGRHFHSSSVNFIYMGNMATIPPVSLLDKVALLSIGLFFIYSIISKGNKKRSPFAIFLLLFGGSTFALYLFAGPLTGQAILISRTSIIWAIAAAMGVGAGWSALTSFLPNIKSLRTIELVLCSALLAWTIYIVSPVPAKPDKMQYDSEVEQFLRIARNYKPTEWMLVSFEEGYALALGTGYHLMAGDFVSWYDPRSKRLARVVDGNKDYLVTPDIFIFQQKNIFQPEVAQTMADIMSRRAQEQILIDNWVKNYMATHRNMTIFYENLDIAVYQIHQPTARDERFREIWGIKEEVRK